MCFSTCSGTLADWRGGNSENAERGLTIDLENDALSDFIQTWYLELMCLLPAVFMLAGLTWVVIMDSYIQKNRKRTMLILCALVFSLIAQNYAENLLALGEPRVMLRTIVAAYGYIVRPMILLLFLKILHPEKKHIPEWSLVGVNAVLYAVSIFVPICFTIKENNTFGGSIFPFGYSCLAVT